MPCFELPNKYSDSRRGDVGCGAGWLCSRLTPFGSVTGTDLSDAVLARAAQRVPQAKFIAGDFMALDLGSDYDVAISLEVLPHVADQPAFLAKIAGLLKPGGYLMLATQNKPALLRNDIPAPKPGSAASLGGPSRTGRADGGSFRGQRDVLHHAAFQPGPTAPHQLRPPQTLGGGRQAQSRVETGQTMGRTDVARLDHHGLGGAPLAFALQYQADTAHRRAGGVFGLPAPWGEGPQGLKLSVGKAKHAHQLFS
jgi:SAM-dependent methyltransferase